MSEKAIWSFLVSKLGNEYGSAGLMGNLYAESGLVSNNLQNSYQKKLGYTDAAYTEAVDSESYTNFSRDKAGYGLAQWTYWSRKRDLLAYAKKTSRSIGDEAMQLEYLMAELQKSFKPVWRVLQSATSVKEASDIVLTKFERPADTSDENKERRAQIGQGFFDTYAATPKTVQIELPVLKKGAKGGAVKALQILLIGYGYSCGASGADGSFGGNTDTAVRAYQKTHGLAVDGSVGAATWNALMGNT